MKKYGLIILVVIVLIAVWYFFQQGSADTDAVDNTPTTEVSDDVTVDDEAVELEVASEDN